MTTWEKSLDEAISQFEKTLQDINAIRNPIERDKAASMLIKKLEDSVMTEAAAVRGEVILSFIADGLSYTDIAGLIGISAPRVGQLKAAALRRRRASWATLSALE